MNSTLLNIWKLRQGSASVLLLLILLFSLVVSRMVSAQSTAEDASIVVVSHYPDNVFAEGDWSGVNVTFNQPIIFGSMPDEMDGYPNPLIISPTVSGSASWWGDSVYVGFTFSEPLVGGQKYVVTVDSDVVNSMSAPGAEMDSDYTYEFTAASPSAEIEWVIPSENHAEPFGWIWGLSSRPELVGNSDVPLDPVFEVTFTESVDKASTEAALTLVGDINAPLEFEWNAENTSVTITVSTLLSYDMPYTLTLDNSAMSEAGFTVQSETRYLTTLSPPQVIDSEGGCFVPLAARSRQDDYYYLYVEFGSPVSVESVAEHFTLEPSVEINLPNDVEYIKSLRLDEALARSTNYTATVTAGLMDPYGTEGTIPWTLSFRTTDLRCIPMVVETRSSTIAPVGSETLILAVVMGVVTTIVLHRKYPDILSS